MKPNRHSALAVALALTIFPSMGRAQNSAAGKAASPKFRIEGYLPDYRVDAFRPEQAASLTDLIYFSIQPRPTGELDLGRFKSASLKTIVQLKEKNGLRLLVCVGGWDRSAGFARVSASADSRKRFAATLTRFCKENGFDGADLDWEHPEGTEEPKNYALLLAEIRRAFEPHRFELTMAIAGWQQLPIECFEAVDRVHLMAYDAGNRHSTFEYAHAEVEKLLKRGIPSRKISLGLPFYGRGIADSSKALTYSEIQQKHQPAANVDEVDGVYFNGPATIERKTAYALKNNLAGVFIWELGQDTAGQQSLLKVIERSSR